MSWYKCSKPMADDLTQSLAQAFSSDRPMFVDVATEPEVENLPPVYNWLKIEPHLIVHSL